MVPGSTFRYGSHFCKLTLKPRLSRRQPIEEAATPLPSEETTPPVTNIYFGAIRIARAVTRFTAPDFSHLSGRPTIARRGVRGRCTLRPRVRNTAAYEQLWARLGPLSIPTLCASACKIFLPAQPFRGLRV